MGGSHNLGRLRMDADICNPQIWNVWNKSKQDSSIAVNGRRGVYMKKPKRDFSSKDFAKYYIKKHTKMNLKLGRLYAEKLRDRGFVRGRALDAGCGFGAMAAVIAEAFPEYEITGIDLSEPLLEYAASSVHGSSLQDRVTFLKGDIQNIEFEDNLFDVVFCVNTVHLVEDPELMLSELERVCKPVGSLYIADIRRSLLKIFERELAQAMTFEEAKDLIGRSALREGSLSKDLLWWKFEA
jgi:ubiquinone/menaquinone biosynthesis C-methylase UbiE